MARSKKSMTYGEPRHQGQSRLLGLAPELRGEIWRHVLSVQPDMFGEVAFRRRAPNASVLGLLETCRQIHSEAAGIFFDQNHLRISDASLVSSRPLGPFITQALSSRRLEGIKAITIELDALLIPKVTKQLAALPRLREVTFAMESNSLRGRNAEVWFRRESYFITKYLRKLRGLRKLDFTCQNGARWHALDGVALKREFLVLGASVSAQASNEE